MRLSVILNAGGRDTSGTAHRIMHVCAEAGVDPHLAIAGGPDIADFAQRALEAGSTTIVAGGGDGTVSTVASVVTGTNATLGVIPLGTLNHFARDAGIPRGVDDAIRVAIDGHTALVDVGEVNGRLFINNSSVGLYPRLVWEREQLQRRGRFKGPAMIAAAMTVWRRYRRVAVGVRSDGAAPRVVRTPFVFVGNNTYQLSGLNFGARERLDGGQLHICMAPELSAGGVVQVMGAVLLGRLVSFEHFESLHSTELVIDARRPRLGVSLDGEVTVLATPLRYRIRRAALRVAIPPADLQRRA